MCGILLVAAPVWAQQQTSVDVIEQHASACEAVLRRRGPDHFGAQQVLVSCQTDAATGTATDTAAAAAATRPSLLLHLAASLLQLRGASPSTSPLGDAHGNVLCFNGEIFGGLELPEGSNDGKCLLAALGAVAAEQMPGLLSTLRGPWSLIYWQQRTQTLWFGRDWLGRRSLLLQHFQDEQQHISSLVLTSVAPVAAPKQQHNTQHSTQAVARAGAAAAEVPSGNAEGQACQETAAGTAAGASCAQQQQQQQEQQQSVWIEVPPGIYSMTSQELFQYLSSSSTCYITVSNSSRVEAPVSRASSCSAAAAAATSAAAAGEEEEAAAPNAGIATPADLCRALQGLQHHPWTDPVLLQLQQFERSEHLIAPAGVSRTQGQQLAPKHGQKQQDSVQQQLGQQEQQQCLPRRQQQELQQELQQPKQQQQQQQGTQQQGTQQQQQQQHGSPAGVSADLQEASQQLLQLLQASVDVRCLTINTLHASSSQQQQQQQHGPQQQQVELLTQQAHQQQLQPQQARSPTKQLSAVATAAAPSTAAAAVAAAAQQLPPAPVLILFSGGVDSTLIAALAHLALPPGVPIDLSNVCFVDGQSPDRQAARSALLELAAFAPERQWRLIEVNSSLEEVDQHAEHIKGLLHPAGTVMDLNIGAALWLATRAEGQLLVPVLKAPAAAAAAAAGGDSVCNGAAVGEAWIAADSSSSSGADAESHAAGSLWCLVPAAEAAAAAAAAGAAASPHAAAGSSSSASSSSSYRSAARVVLLGHGADEQCAGYGRHRTKFKLRGWQGLADELAVDVKRLWIRNLGRDDRLVSDHGREGRHPFLDEGVMAALLDTHTACLAQLSKPLGVGDKQILRQALASLGLPLAASREKRAIQFGTRIGKLSNRREFGSNRKANLAAAGQVKYTKLPSPATAAAGAAAAQGQPIGRGEAAAAAAVPAAPTDQESLNKHAE